MPALAASSANVDSLEARRLLSGGTAMEPLVAPEDLVVTVGYREAPDGGTTRAHLTWADTNTSETGYRVEYSSDGAWTPIGPDLLPNSTTAAHVLNAGQKLYYRVLALSGTAVSTPSNTATAMMPIDRVVQVWATNAGDTISLRWPLDPDAVSYKVYRKSRASNHWTLLTPTALAATSTGYTDPVPQGQAYEYQVERLTRNFYGVLDGTAYGYVYAGNRLATSDTRGRVLLVVDQTRAGAISSELTRYRRDLLSDGWAVQQITVARDNGDARQAAAVKAQIRAAAAAQNGPLKSIVLIGHVPVPYSGTTAWDGHPDHNGAWPADGYYGEGIGTDDAGTWTDSLVAPNLTRPDNNNLPGDGKFDQDNYPGAITVPVGRIDFANLPGMRHSFSPVAPDADAGETLLLKRYFDKNHDWRTRTTVVSRTAIEDDHLGGGTAENGWRNFTPLVSASSTTAADWVTTMGETSNLWSAGAGPGSIEYATGIVGIDQFHSPSAGVYSVFNLMSGSWFGDWNKQSNLMREMVSANGTSLAAIWAGTPNLFLQTMGLGETLGQAMMLSQNNTLSGPYQPASSGTRGTHMALIGDPTLTMSIVSPVTGLDSDRQSNVNSVTWTAPADNNVTGFHVYRADSPDGPFFRLNSSAIPTQGMGVTMTFTDPSSIRTMKKFTYMVRAIKMQMTPSGRYENYSWGETVQSKLTNSDSPDGPVNPGSIIINHPVATAPTVRVATSIFSNSAIDSRGQSNPLDDLGL